MRTEPDGKVSVGLCQTLCSTARWLITDTTPAAPPKLLVHRPVGAPVPKPPGENKDTCVSDIEPHAHTAHIFTARDLLFPSPSTVVDQELSFSHVHTAEIADPSQITLMDPFTAMW